MATKQSNVSKVASYKLDPFMSGVVAALVGMVVILLLRSDGDDLLLALGVGVVLFALGYLSRRFGGKSKED
ncbi:hypothetical protein ENKNEFLB_03617 [Nocardioides aquaticus]|uniref:Uncharacterized protein n=2 Tax=Actinomycetes TaxID=1760 RepID=A0ABN1TC16_9ACTN|nr:hypothetical protein [Nocardioides aquaticus]QVT81209.1 hypothetical protein ENKNEFLB_03617 [Nocardioides aquaticus]